jgi:hypothetical protein
MNRTRVTTLSVALLTMVTVAGALLATSSGAVMPALSADIAISPAAQHDGAYSCTARISDASTGTVLSEPTVLFRSGENATLRSGVELQGKASEVIVTVSADGAKKTATVRIELVDGGRRSTVQAVNVQL